MRRREFLLLVCGAGAFISFGPVSAEGQPARRHRIGYLTHGSGPSSLDKAFVHGMQELGYIDGENIEIQFRFAEGKVDRLPTMARDLVESGVDLIVTPGPLGTRAAVEATPRIPIVMMVADPVASGFVSSYSRPGGNVTGRSFLGTELSTKRLEVLKEALPGLGRIAALFNASNPGSRHQVQTTVEAAHKLELTVAPIDVGGGGAIEDAFARAARESVGAVIVLSQGQNVSPDENVGAAGLKHLLPTMFASKPYVRAGGLMSYGPDIADVYRQATRHVDRIFKGATPGDLPVEQPTKFELVINLSTAKAIGLEIPPLLLARADEVIE